MAVRVPPAGFVAELVRRFGAGHDARFNETLNRWEVITPSASGKPIAQVWGWFYTVDRATGERRPIPPNPDGLPPFRELDGAAQREIIENMERSFVGNLHDGAESMAARIRRIAAENAAKKADARRRRAETFTHLLTEVRIARRWKPDHVRNQGPKLYSLPSLPASGPVANLSTRSSVLTLGRF